MYAADDDSSTLLPASAGIERNAADKAESAARAAASRVTAWLQRSPTGPLARASCDSASLPASPDSASPDSASPDSASPDSVLAAADDASADKTAGPAKDASDEDDAEASTPAPPVATTAD